MVAVAAAARPPAAPAPARDLLDVPKMRYAGGEITEEEYERMKKVLEG